APREDEASRPAPRLPPARGGAPRCDGLRLPRARRLAAEDGSARAREESRLDEQRHDLALTHRLAVETLDREALLAGGAHVCDKRVQGGAKPFRVRIPQRHERAAA